MSSILNIFKGKDDTLLGFIPLSKKQSDLMPNIKKTDLNNMAFNPNDIFIMIDDKNSLNKIDEDHLSELNERYDEYKQKDAKRLEATNKIMNKFLEKIVPKFDDFFTLSQNIAKQIAKNDKIDKDLIEKCLNTLITRSKNNIYRLNSLKLNIFVCRTIGAILSYAYQKMSNYKIKDMKKLVEIRKNIINNKIDILKDFLKYCKEKNKEKKTKLLKLNKVPLCHYLKIQK